MYTKHTITQRGMPTCLGCDLCCVMKRIAELTCSAGQNRIYDLCIVDDRMFGDFPARNTVYIYTWFWPTLFMRT